MVYVLLAEGFEEIEAIAPIDLMRRAGCDVKTVSVSDDKTVIGAHAIPLVADMTIDEINVANGLQAVILPGGMPGTLNLEKNDAVQKLIDVAVEQEAIIGAICAAPSILGHKGLLIGRRAVCYPGFETALVGSHYDWTAPVVTDGPFVTAKGAGAAVEFGLELVSVLAGDVTAAALREGIQCK